MARGIRVEGIDYTPDGVRSTREGLIQIRDAALLQNEFTWAVLLSHVVAYMAEYAEILEEEARG